jgi:hypothetical protein
MPTGFEGLKLGYESSTGNARDPMTKRETGTGPTDIASPRCSLALSGPSAPPDLYLRAPLCRLTLTQTPAVSFRTPYSLPPLDDIG